MDLGAQVADDPDHETLSAQERLTLADLEAALRRDDPDLDASLSGFRRRARPLKTSVEAVLAISTVVMGAILMMATFTRWLPAATVGVALQVLGFWLSLDTARRRWRSHAAREAHGS